ncbi:MAG: ABC transporter permease [Wenzhouxiangella sp.]|nr:ABC transporter permease [Wenzhouxiangella sp.]MDR9452950.1 ABC transporter permease [Wenzhouxiangella sp.]
MKSVWFKEVKDNLRDRRVVLSTLVFGPLFGPVLLVVMLGFAERQTSERLETALELPVVGASNAPNLIGYLERQGVIIKPAPDDPESAIEDETEEVIVRIPEGFAEAWSSGRSAPVEVLADQSRRYAGTTIARVRGHLDGYGRTIGQLRLQMRGLDPELTRPINIVTVDLSTPEARGGMVLSFLPYFILIMVFVGSMHMATDTTAGERERKSLEPLLINPLPRWQIMAGKLAATTTFGLLTLVLGLVAFVIAMGFLPLDNMNMTLNLDFQVAAWAFLMTAPAALFAAALLIILASFAKSYREAQSYMGMVVLVPMLPSLYILINPTKAEQWMTLVPLLSQNVLILELVRGEPINALWVALCVGSTTLAALALAAVAGTLYSRPKLIFTSD